MALAPARRTCPSPARGGRMGDGSGGLAPENRGAAALRSSSPERRRPLEAAHLCPSLRIFSIERDDEQIANLRENRIRFDAESIEVMRGEAPEALEPLPAPDRVFIGGSGGRLGEIVRLAGMNDPRGLVPRGEEDRQLCGHIADDLPHLPGEPAGIVLRKRALFCSVRSASPATQGRRGRAPRGPATATSVFGKYRFSRRQFLRLSALQPRSQIDFPANVH